MIPAPQLKPLEDVVVALTTHGQDIHLDLLGRRYSDFRVSFSRSEVQHALEDYSPSRAAVDPLVAFGSTLFNALFSAERGHRLWELLDRVTNENRALRLRILSNVERTQYLPWELLFDSSRRDFVSLSGRIALVRTRPDGWPGKYVPNTRKETLPRLRLLAVSAAPGSDDHLGKLVALAQAHSEILQVTALSQATCAELLQKLDRKDSFDVFLHFGNGVVLPGVSKAGGLPQALQMAVKSKGDDGLLNRNSLGKALKHSGVRLGAIVGNHSDWVARSLAKHLPASIGFRETIRDETGRIARDALCRVLLGGMPVDLAVTSVRQAIDRDEPGTGEWCKLIFYLQTADGGLLLPAPSSAQAPERQPLEGMSPGTAKLVRLREVYQTNLAALEQGINLLGDTGGQKSDEVDSLRKKIEDLGQRIAASASAESRDGAR